MSEVQKKMHDLWKSGRSVSLVRTHSEGGTGRTGGH